MKLTTIEMLRTVDHGEHHLAKGGTYSVPADLAARLIKEKSAKAAKAKD